MNKVLIFIAGLIFLALASEGFAKLYTLMLSPDVYQYVYKSVVHVNEDMEYLLER